MTTPWYKKASVQTAIVVGLFAVAAALVAQYGPKTRLEGEVTTLREKIHGLETELAPFRAIAVERFGGPEQAALVKLAEQLRDLQSQLARQAGTIRRFDVTAVATLTGNWKSTTPPDFSKLFRGASRGSDIRLEIKTAGAGMRWVDFPESTVPPRMTAGEGGNWILDYSYQVSAGSWILGTNRDEILTCGALEMVLYGINRDVTQDGVVTVVDTHLTFYVNGVPAYRCHYPGFRAEISQAAESAIRVRLNGPAVIEKIP